MGTYKEKNHQLTDPYVTAGNRVYVIGAQNGLFPDEGGHIAGEMAGVWNHPIKLLDGFFVGIRDEAGTRWPTAKAFRTYSFYTEHHYDEAGFQLVRRQFVPDNEELAFITFEVVNQTATPLQLDLIFAVKSDLRPGWLGEETDGQDVVAVRENSLVFTDSANPWSVAVCSDLDAQQTESSSLGCPFETKGNGAFGALILPLTCEAGQTATVTVCIAGSLTDSDRATERVKDGLNRYESLWQAKQQRYEELDNTSKVTVPNADLNDTVRWVKFNTDWLVRDVPAIGNGLGAGLPEYPWWFGCDNGYALQGVLAAGAFSVAEDTLRLLASVSARENGNGRIIHEVSTTDVVFNPGNTQETPQFCMTVWETFKWTGNLEFLREMYPAVQKAIEWTISMAPDGNDLAVGYGIMEVENLNAKLIDTAVYTEQAFEAYAQMSTLLGYEDVATQMRERAEKLREEILNRFWLADEGLYADVLVDSQGMNQHLYLWADRQDKEGRHRAAEEYRSLIDKDAHGERPFLLKNWVISTPVETGIAPKAQAEQLLARMRTPEFKGSAGLYLSGIDQTHMMTISTSVQAVAECRYGHVDEAVEWLEQLAATRDLRVPGSISEMSPDYGCFVQAWTIYGAMVPIVRHMFGVDPLAHKQCCSIDVCMPKTWNTAKLERLRVGENDICLQYERVGDEEQLTIRTTLDWTFQFARPVTVLQQAGLQTPVSDLQISAGETVTVRFG